MGLQKTIISCLHKPEGIKRCAICGGELQSYYEKTDDNTTFARCPDCTEIFSIRSE